MNIAAQNKALQPTAKAAAELGVMPLDARNVGFAS